MLNVRGQALIQVLVATAILGILMAAFTSMLSMHQRENQRLSDNLAKMDLERVLTSDLQDGSVCTFILTTPTAAKFDPLMVRQAIPPEFSFTQVPSSAVAGSPAAVKVDAVNPASTISGNLFTKSITVKNLVCDPMPCTATSNLFEANLVIDFDSAKLIAPIAPLALPLKFQTVTSGAQQAVSACLGNGPSITGIPAVTGTSDFMATIGPGCTRWQVTAYTSIVVEVWGGGGGGGNLASNGDSSSFGSVIANGGRGALGGCGPGGKAYGGDVNTDGLAGTLTAGGASPNGGGGGGQGANGAAPGGGGGGGMRMCGGGGGGYAKKTFAPGELVANSFVTVCVGAPGANINPGSGPFAGGTGGVGNVRLTVN